MRDTSWITMFAAALFLVALALSALFLRRRITMGRKGRPDDTDVMRTARHAIHESAGDRRRRERGSLRGKGYGGNNARAYDAGFTSDTGGMP
ncbi:hypothetical protein ACN267_09375 [Micromonospora sp. WMMD734]|uniref:hypothetical protein n=1 Tax=Micromonospora sp. WMMD734 TaxID=3404129 RepID=UPI003B96385C